MFEEWSPTALLVHAAALTYVIGFLVRDQLKLRLLLQLGSMFYIAYYFFEPETPLWDAIAWTVIMFTANAWTIHRIMTDRREVKFDEDDLVLFGAIPSISPGDFRRLMAKAQKDTAFVNIALTHQGRNPRNLWFMVSGSATVEKDGAQRQIEAPAFVGEVGRRALRPLADGRIARISRRTGHVEDVVRRRVQSGLGVKTGRELSGGKMGTRIEY